MCKGPVVWSGCIQEAVRRRALLTHQVKKEAGDEIREEDRGRAMVTAA